MTYRYGPHTLSGDDPKRYRTKEIDDAWLKKDPLVRMRHYLADKGIWTQEKEDQYAEEVQEQIKEAIDKVENMPKQKISEYLKNTFAATPAGIQQEIERFEAKEAK